MIVAVPLIFLFILVRIKKIQKITQLIVLNEACFKFLDDLFTASAVVVSLYASYNLTKSSLVSVIFTNKELVGVPYVYLIIRCAIRYYISLEEKK
ncbi:MAG: hypothetical protein LLG02_00030 [Pelosinus sp.]|nr:hypothetical protein [Pelosinus sp.]